MKYFFEQKSDIEINIRYNLNFPSHLHEQLEIGYIEEGSVVLTVDEAKYALKPGDFFVIFPNQIHSYESSQNLKAKMLIFPPRFAEDFSKLFSTKIPQCSVVPATKDTKRLVELLFDLKSDNIVVLKGFLLALFGILLDCLSLIDIDKYNVSALKNILIYCSEHFSESIAISDVADALHISRYHIAHIFRQKLDTTFSEYISKKRIDHACKLLPNEELSIAEVAYQSGFNSLRSFNRHFLKQENISPKEYRKGLLQ